jgi:broad specificity phosphatase PhoE
MTKKGNDETTIYIVRHGESESNVFARENPDKPASHYGEFGSSLTKKGRDQSHQLSLRLIHIHFDAIFSSDLNRAIETAKILAKDRNLQVVTNQIIRERFFGNHMSNRQKRQIEKALDALNEEKKFAFKYFPNGENGYDVVRRFHTFLEEIIKAYKNKTVLVVSHSYVMRSFLIHEHYATFDELLGGSIKNAGYFIIKTDGKTFRIIDRHGITRNRGYDDEE